MNDNSHLLIVQTLLTKYFNINEEHAKYMLNGVLAPDQFYKSEVLIHTKNKTQAIVNNLIKTLDTADSKTYYYNIGQICHYHTDWFCYYHKEDIFFNLFQHYKYEKDLYKLYKFQYEQPCFWDKIKTSMSNMLYRGDKVSLESMISKLYSQYIEQVEDADDKHFVDVHYSTVSVMLTLQELLSVNHRFIRH